VASEVGLYNVQFDHERDRALENARARRAEAQVLTEAGNQRAAAVFLAAARIYDGSAQYWEEESRILRARTSCRDAEGDGAAASPAIES
jgi:hypothetical protein